MRTRVVAALGAMLLVALVAIFLALGGGERPPALAPAVARPAAPAPAPTPAAAVRPSAARPAAARQASGALPMAGLGHADLDFLSDVARATKAPPPPSVERLVALATSGAAPARLREAVESELSGDLVLRLIARRWLAGRDGEPAPPLAVPRPATALVGELQRTQPSE